ncbi:MAG: DoxX family protein [Candidatus Peribacteraceae bacterium]
MKKQLAFWIPTALLLFPMVGSAIYYFIDIPTTAKAFNDLGYPAYVLYFNATAKILGGIAIVLPQFPRWMKEFAYAGYLYIILLAAQAIYIMMPIGNAAFMLVFIVLWAWAYWAFRKKAV